MWKVVFNRLEQRWVVEEYDRHAAHEQSVNGHPLTFHFRADAELSCSVRDKSQRADRHADLIDLGDPSEIWPGAAVSYASSRG